MSVSLLPKKWRKLAVVRWFQFRTIRSRLLLMLAVPLLGLSALALSLCWRFYGEIQKSRQENEKLEVFTATLKPISEYVSSLQRERIFANAYLVSSQEEHLVSMGKQVGISESLEGAAIDAIEGVKKYLDANVESDEEAGRANSLQSQKERIVQMRADVKSGTAKQGDLFNLYNKYTTALTEIDELMVKQITNAKLAYLFSGYMGLNAFKEQLSIEDALILGIMLKDQMDESEKKLFDTAMGARSTHYSTFKTKAPFAVFSVFYDINSPVKNGSFEVHDSVQKQRVQLTGKSSGFGADARKWFDDTQKKWGYLLLSQEAYSKEFLQQAKSLSDSNTRNFYLLIVFLVILGGVSVFLCVLSIRNIRGALVGISAEISQSTDTSSDAVKAVADASATLSRQAMENASAIEEINASLVEISSKIGQARVGADEAKVLSGRTKESVNHGLVQIQTLNNAMTEIKATGEQISHIIQSIDEIAFQTNILALNAAVEAARAGEVGAGFAIVADEVRSLARRSAEAAASTNEIIGVSVAKTQAGSEAATRVSSYFEKISSQVAAVDERVSQVSASSTEQERGIHQISEAVKAQENGAQGLATASSDTTEASASLLKQVEIMRSSLEELNRLAGVPAGKAGAL